jgi:uncharacterized protein YajQ (UPF0234 family)
MLHVMALEMMQDEAFRVSASKKDDLHQLYALLRP